MMVRPSSLIGLTAILLTLQSCAGFHDIPLLPKTLDSFGLMYNKHELHFSDYFSFPENKQSHAVSFTLLKDSFIRFESELFASSPGPSKPTVHALVHEENMNVVVVSINTLCYGKNRCNNFFCVRIGMWTHGKILRVFGRPQTREIRTCNRYTRLISPSLCVSKFSNNNHNNPQKQIKHTNTPYTKEHTTNTNMQAPLTWFSSN